MPISITPREFAEDILRRENIWILTHGHPDGDTIGSGEALLNALCAVGKNAALLCGDTLTDHLDFMRGYADPSRCFFGNATAVPFMPSYIVSVDVAAEGLIAGLNLPENAQIALALDHHEVNTLPCERLLVDPTASAAGEVLFEVLCELEALTGKSLIDTATASALYVAIASDSGNFKYASTSSRTLRIAAELIDKGADSAQISRRLFDIHPFSVYCAEAMCTDNVRFYEGGQMAFSYMAIEQCAERAIPATDFDTCVNLLRCIKGVELAVFAKEKEKLPDGTSRYRLSLRSNETVNVADLAARFGGGGHKRAAGCAMCGTPESMAESLLSALKDMGVTLSSESAK